MVDYTEYTKLLSNFMTKQIKSEKDLGNDLEILKDYSNYLFTNSTELDVINIVRLIRHHLPSIIPVNCDINNIEHMRIAKMHILKSLLEKGYIFMLDSRMIEILDECMDNDSNGFDRFIVISRERIGREGVFELLMTNAVLSYYQYDGTNELTCGLVDTDDHNISTISNNPLD